MWQTFVGLVDGFKLTTLGVLIGVDFLLGIIVAVKEGTFQFNKLADFLNTSVLCYVGGYFMVGLIAAVHSEFAFLVTSAWGILDITLLAGIWGKLKKLGVPTPKIVSD